MDRKSSALAVAAAWTAAVAGVDGDASASASAADLVERYSQPHRAYHGLAHVAAVVRDSAWLGRSLALPRRQVSVVALAACAHDVVYDARPGADERASADWVAAHLTASGVAAHDVREVTRLVLATVSHEAGPGDELAAALLDADLGILGADRDDYLAYVRGVRFEYSAVSEDDWRVGRAAVLRGLLERDRLYMTAAASERWDVSARANLTRELTALESPRA